MASKYHKKIHVITHFVTAQHILRETEYLESFECTICNVICKDIKEYRYHLSGFYHVNRKCNAMIQETISNGMKKFKCSTCLWSDNHQSLFTIHLQSKQHIEMEYWNNNLDKTKEAIECKYCNAKFINYLTLNHHYQKQPAHVEPLQINDQACSIDIIEFYASWVNQPSINI